MHHADPLPSLDQLDHILWDWNGTLLDDTAYCAQVINTLLRERGLAECQVDEHRRLFDFPVRDFYQRLGFDFERESFEAMSEVFIGRYYQNVDRCAIHAGARPLLTALQRRGIRQSILSASRQDYLDQMVATHGLRHHFDSLLGIENIFARGKTHRGAAWLATAGVAANRVLLIGDTLHDLEVAQTLGIHCCLVSCGAHAPDRLQGVTVPVHPTLESVAAALLGTMPCEG
jgi:phosphoglycolate phosphatase